MLIKHEGNEWILQEGKEVRGVLYTDELVSRFMDDPYHFLSELRSKLQQKTDRKTLIDLIDAYLKKK